MPVIPCPHCQATVEIHPDDLGYKVLCPSCHSAFQAGETVRPAPEPAPAPPDREPEPTPEPDPGERTVRCVACRGEMAIGVEDLGHKVECPLCGERFRAESDERSRSRSERRRPPREYPDADDDEDYENDRDYGGRRRRGYREQDRGYILAEAREAIAWPANGLMWTGIVMLVLYVIAAVGFIVAGIAKQESTKAYERENGVVMILLAAVLGAICGTHAFFMALAGYKSKQLRGPGWGYTAGAIGIATFALSHPCFPTMWIAVTFGIWALVAFNKREVKDAIRINTGKRL